MRPCKSDPNTGFHRAGPIAQGRWAARCAPESGGPIFQIAQSTFGVSNAGRSSCCGIQSAHSRVGGGGAAGDAFTKFYVLRSWMPAALRMRWLQRPRGALVEQEGFEVLVLALTLMSGERISESGPPPPPTRHTPAALRPRPPAAPTAAWASVFLNTHVREQNRAVFMCGS